MSDAKNAFYAGLVVLVGTAIGLAFFVVTRKSTLTTDNSKTYYALLSDASGINAKSLITVAGLQVGEIERVYLTRVPLGDFAKRERAALEDAYAALARDGGVAEGQRLLKRAQYEQMHSAWVQRYGASDAERASWEQGNELGAQAQPMEPALKRPPAWNAEQLIPVARVDMKIISDLEIPTDSWLKKESLGLLGAKALFLELGTSDTVVADAARIENVRSQTGMDALQNRAEAIVASLESIARKVDRDIGGITHDIHGITHTLHQFVAGDQDSPPLDEVYSLVMNEVRKVATAVESAVRNVDRMMAGNDSAIAGLLQNLESISSDIATLTAGPTGSPLPDGTVPQEGDLRRTMTQVRKVTDDLAVVTGSLKEIIGANEGEVDQGVKQLKNTLGELNRSLTSMAEVTGRIERGEGTVGKLLTDERMADKLENAVSGASDFVAGLTSLETHVDLGTWYNMNEGTARVNFGLRLQPKPDKYYLIEIIEDGGGIERLTRTLSNSSSSGSNADSTEREVIREYDNSIRFSAMFAKKFFDFLVLRAGVIETSGGLGANLLFWDDRIELRSDVFNFSGPRNKVGDDPLYGNFAWPRWRTLLKVQPVPYLYVTAGVDDVLNVQANPSVNGYGFDYFFGAGLTFQDEDLRSILPFIPSF